MPTSMQLLLLALTTLYQAVATVLEARQPPPGQFIHMGQHRLHFCVAGEAKIADKICPTIVLDHSLGGIEGYLLMEDLAKLSRTCIYDRAGYGWSDHSPFPRTSEQIVQELDQLLTTAQIEPPYLLIGDSFGSYNVRLYAHRFPQKVAGIVLTDGLHESEMLKMSVSLQALKFFFISGFLMSTLGSILGFIRLLENVGGFELLKPELRPFSRESRDRIKRSFCRPKHWITMSREMINLEKSARQMRVAEHLGAIPIVSIKASSFFKPSIWSTFIPLRQANQLRDRMHLKLCQLSTDCLQIEAPESGHFVWVDQPEIIMRAIEILLEKIELEH